MKNKKKTKLKIPGKMTAYAWARNKSYATGLSARYWYQILKDYIIKDAEKQPKDMGEDLVLKFNDGHQEYHVHVKRRL